LSEPIESVRTMVAKTIGVATLAIALSGQAPAYDRHIVPVTIKASGVALVGCIGVLTNDQIAFANRIADYKRYDPHMLIDLVIEKGAPDASVVKFRTTIRQSGVKLTNHGTYCP
jgi:hypothetical protein